MKWSQDADTRLLNNIGTLRSITTTIANVRFKTPCRRPFSSHWWWLLWYPYSTTKTQCAARSVLRHTWFAAASRCRTQLHGWSSNFDASIILYMLSTVCASQSGSSTRSPYWRSCFCMGLWSHRILFWFFSLVDLAVTFYSGHSKNVWINIIELKSWETQTV